MKNENQEKIMYNLLELELVNFVNGKYKLTKKGDGEVFRFTEMNPEMVTLILIAYSKGDNV